MAAAKKRRESSARAKCSSAMSATDPKVDKSSPAKDAAYVRRRVDENGPFGLRPEMCRCV
ncbi:hypothetical protein GBA52_029147 [Prunus armeniaca]|nr:hypothetical protein GBA52_029147 [Prunus armeniaca]